MANLVVKGGVASLSGMARSLEAKEECENIISNIKGITNVNNNLTVHESYFVG